MDKGAIISECGKYRFALWRIWDGSLSFCMFIMHNPSTADGFIDDPTIRRCISFANSWGYGGIYVGNLTPYRATNPKDLLKIGFEEMCPTENILHINDMRKMCRMHVFAYGNPVTKDLIPELWDDCFHYLKLTKAGNPSHPLYLKSDLIPKPFLAPIL